MSTTTPPTTTPPPTLFQQAGQAIKTASTFSPETKLRIEEAKKAARAKLSAAAVSGMTGTKKYMALLKEPKNLSITLFTLLFIMVITNFALFVSIDFAKIKNDDVDELAKLNHLYRISYVTFTLVCLVAIFEVMHYREAIALPSLPSTPLFP